jgi:DNA-binding CsgD family transcriptional regulator
MADRLHLEAPGMLESAIANAAAAQKQTPSEYLDARLENREAWARQHLLISAVDKRLLQQLGQSGLVLLRLMLAGMKTVPDMAQWMDVGTHTIYRWGVADVRQRIGGSVPLLVRNYEGGHDQLVKDINAALGPVTQLPAAFRVAISRLDADSGSEAEAAASPAAEPVPADQARSGTRKLAAESLNDSRLADRLQPQHYEITQLLAQGHTPREVSEMLGVKLRLVYHARATAVRKADLEQEPLSDFERDLLQRFFNGESNEAIMDSLGLTANQLIRQRHLINEKIHPDNVHALKASGAPAMEAVLKAVDEARSKRAAPPVTEPLDVDLLTAQLGDAGRVAKVAAAWANLTDRDRDLLNRLPGTASRKQVSQSLQEISEALGIKQSTLIAYKVDLLRKLGLSAAEFAAYAGAVADRK